MTKTFSSGLATPEGSTRFHTLHFLSAAPQGGGWSGSCDLHFLTPPGQQNYVTMLSPEGVQELHRYLSSVLASLPKPPSISFPVLGGQIAGTLTYGPDTKTYFGQNYKIDIIQTLGVLTIRANIIDQALIDMMCALTGVSPEQGHAQYYATVNMKARLDAVRAVLPVSGLSEDLTGDITTALEKTKAAADRRNDLVHARWSFRKGKHRATIFRPNSKTKQAEITVTEKHILEIAEAYAVATTLLIAGTSGVLGERKGS